MIISIKLIQLNFWKAYEKLKSYSLEKKTNQAEELENVTLLYADIAGFTKYASTTDSNKVMATLRSLFTAFDKKCLANRVFKLYTIGDCYVVMGVQNIASRDYVQEAENVVNMASGMIEEIVKIRKNYNFPFHELDMRIGIHTVKYYEKSEILIFFYLKGNFIGGVIGSDIARYDIFGDDVLITNKIEQTGLEGNIVISESTKKLLEKGNVEYIFADYKVEEFQDKFIQTYLICKKSNTSIVQPENKHEHEHEQEHDHENT